MSILEPFKTPLDSETFINKVDEVLKTTTDVHNLRLREGDWSLFEGEIFPMKTLLEAKRNLWHGIKIKMFLDKAVGPDAEVEGLENIKYLEITEVGFDKYELLSMKKMNRCHYGLPSSPDRETEGLREIVNSDEPYFEFYSCDERYKKCVKMIITRINDKKEKYASAVNNKTALLVSFDDYGRLGRADGNDEFRDLLEKSKIEKDPFANIFVVGRGKSPLYLEL